MADTLLRRPAPRPAPHADNVVAALLPRADPAPAITGGPPTTTAELPESVPLSGRETCAASSLLKADAATDPPAADLNDRPSRRRLLRLYDRVAVETGRDAIREVDRRQGVVR